jgi:hypothetical protein
MAHEPCGVGQQLPECAGHVVRLQRSMASEHADDDLAADDRDPILVSDPVEVDDRLGSSEAKVHGGYQALSACENLDLAPAAEQLERFLDVGGSEVLEGRRLHGAGIL